MNCHGKSLNRNFLSCSVSLEYDEKLPIVLPTEHIVVVFLLYYTMCIKILAVIRRAKHLLRVSDSVVQFSAATLGAFIRNIRETVRDHRKSKSLRARAWSKS